jgi:Cu(I)/Ag(I) efflux system membrane fusion protein
MIEILAGLTAGEKVVTQGNLLIDGQAEINRAFAEPALGTNLASPAEPDPAANATTATNALPLLTSPQREAIRAFLKQVDGVTTSLAADDLEAFNRAAAGIHAGLTALMDKFSGVDPAWHPFLQRLEAASHLERAPDLKAARQAFHPFSTAVVSLSRALRRADRDFTGVRLLRCPMTKDSFPGAPTRAEWIQLQPEVRNPYFGAEMLDCGSEVK